MVPISPRSFLSGVYSESLRGPILALKRSYWLILVIFPLSWECNKEQYKIDTSLFILARETGINVNPRFTEHERATSNDDQKSHCWAPSCTIFTGRMQKFMNTLTNTLAAWYVNLERTPINGCQQLLAPPRPPTKQTCTSTISLQNTMDVSILITRQSQTGINQINKAIIWKNMFSLELPKTV